ncbi:MAG TPA: bifunctional diguanylate cyclase/phosphodiesterase [Persephonella sp.]|nr:bifunctional diguanylate cyclase/phosphodiesterase [Persephonella sp.]
MKSRGKIIFLSILAVSITILFLAFSEVSKRFHSLNKDTLNLIEDLQNYENKLSIEVLKSSFFIYYNYNNITSLFDKIERKINELEQLENFSVLFPKTFESFKEYKNSYFKEKEYILRYITINSVMKNSQIYIPSLALRYLKIAKGNVDYGYFKVLMKTVSAVFLLKNSLNDRYISELKNFLKILKKYSTILKTKEEKQFNEAFIRHISTIIKNFPVYKNFIDILIKKNYTTELLGNISKIFLYESKEKAKIFSIFSISVNILFLIFISYISFLLLKIDQQNVKLKLLAQDLEKSLKTDELTGLLNRLVFNEDVLSKYKEPSLILINIDNFKGINDIYGDKIGDILLIKMGYLLKEFFRNRKNLNPNIYRLGADEFGILIEDNKDKIYEITQNLIHKIENEKFIIDDFNLYITVSAGISHKKPLFETADLALKEAKTTKERIIIYNEDLKIKEHLEKNLKVINLVKYALENEKILLYFQPIFNNKTLEIEKYEVLFRIEDENGNIVFPGDILPVIKETKYYRYLTEKIITKTLETLEKHKYVKFSINISYEDIADNYIKNNVILKKCSNKNLKNRLTFEILESESIKDFENVREFVENIKKLDIQFAIDDFGSGYSNFLYLAELKPDFLKIDGSLIREIHQKKELRNIVETINHFAHSLGVKTVAEFVHNEEVFNVVKEIGIDYSQGFYLGKPSPEIKS